ncbi:MAG: rRNA maturation RNase YbeY [Desulfobacterota bacterium]|nr:rRNA maturation RNase YbeY [Thermodesulfobacteriota bacterium]
MKIWIRNRQRLIPLDRRKIKRLAQEILGRLGLPEAELSLSLVLDEEIRQLNRRYLGRDRPTNVLAFSMGEGEFGGLNPHLLGDVVISVETAKRQAKQAGLTEMEMIGLLLIHGVLHLAGYDHEGGGRGARDMSFKQSELFDRYRPILKG